MISQSLKVLLLSFTTVAAIRGDVSSYPGSGPTAEIIEITSVYPWLKNGRFWEVRTPVNGSIVFVHFYEPNDRNTKYTTTGSARDVAIVIAQEFPGGIPQAQLERDFPYFFADAFLAKDARVVDASYRGHCEQNNDEKLHGRIREICTAPVVKTEGSVWNLDLNVFYEGDGRLEKWRLKGVLQPFGIKEMYCETEDIEGIEMPSFPR